MSDMQAGKTAQIMPLLKELQLELERLQLWSALPPSEEALASVMPFMYDTLKPYEWLQWVFIPRTWALLEAGRPLPGNCNIHPLMEHYFAPQDAVNSHRLLKIVRAIDLLMCA